MGSRHSSAILPDLGPPLSPSQVERDYHFQLYCQNKKTPPKLAEELASIVRRTEVLPYRWAQVLVRILTVSPTDKQYADYKAVLQANCLTDGWEQKAMVPLEVRKQFMRDFQEKWTVTDHNHSLRNLSNLVKECKCYLMVLLWLHQLTTLRSAEENHQNLLATEYHIVLNSLISLSTACFTAQKGKRPRSHSPLSEDLILILESLNKRQSFGNREKLMVKLEQLLAEDPEQALERLCLICEVLGRERALAHLFVVRQMGTVDLPICFGYLAGELDSQGMNFP